MSAFRLVHGPYQDHLKFNGREPRTLAELANARADYAHRRRVAEIKALSKKMLLLDALLPMLAQQGMRLHNREILGEDRGKVLRIQAGIFMDDSALLRALLAVGFREIGRETWGRTYEKVTLKHGRALLVAIDVKRTEGDSAAPAAGSVSGVGLGQGDGFAITGDVDQGVAVTAAGAQEVTPLAVDLGGDRPEHDFEAAASARPHGCSPVEDGNLTAGRALP